MTDTDRPAQAAADPAASAALILKAVADDRLPPPDAKPRHPFLWAGMVLTLALGITWLIWPAAESLPPATTARSEILKIEERLATLAFPPGPVDGIADAETSQAIRDFQRAAGLPEDGRATPALLEELGALTAE